MDYNEIELKCGIEIHQQIDTSKLFCRCPSVLRQDEPDIKIERRMYAAAGESGIIDISASYEQSRNRKFIYEGYSDANCLVEFDESPPLEIDKEALRTALQISLLLNAKPLSVAQIMRKTVVDGSNTSGFQRTMLIATDGYIEINSRRIRIDSICLEEDAARIIKQENDNVVFRLDRLGIPLIEIATSPDIKNPSEAKETALKLGEIIRSCKVKRGIGTIRQDVNMSIFRGARIEIKGVQEPALIAKTIDTEIERQLKLLKEGKKIQAEVRKAEVDGATTFLRPLPGKARMYPETDLPFIRIDNKLIDEIKKALPRLKHEIKAELEEKMHSELAKALLNENKLNDYKVLIKIYNKPDVVAKMLAIWPKEISSHEKIEIEKVCKKLNIDVFEAIAEALASGKIYDNNVKGIMSEVAKGKNISDALKIEAVELKDVENDAKKIIHEKPGLNINAYMGLLIHKYKGKISGKEIMEILKKYVK